MNTRSPIGTFTLVMTLDACALCTTLAVAAAEDSKYLDLQGPGNRRSRRAGRTGRKSRR